MKIAVIILSVVLAVAVGLFIWKAVEAKKAKEKNIVLDPTNVVTPATVAVLTSNANNPAVNTSTAPVPIEATTQLATARMATREVYGV